MKGERCICLMDKRVREGIKPQTEKSASGRGPQLSGAADHIPYRTIWGGRSRRSEVLMRFLYTAPSASCMLKLLASLSSMRIPESHGHECHNNL